jgi:outer membrane protein
METAIRPDRHVPARPRAASAARRRRASGRAATLLVMFSFLFFFGACFNVKTLSKRTAPSPEAPWTPPAPARPAAPAVPPPEIPAELLAAGRKWTLTDLVDVGLRNNPQTKAAWNQALAASAGVDIALAAFFPEITAGAAWSKTEGSAIGGRFTFNYSSWDFSADLNYLLLDFGGRTATLRSARQALAAANWTQNSAIQGVILLIEQAYYRYLASRALLQADEASLKEAESNLEAANIRHDAGVATIADVLRARTARSQALLNLVTDRGAAQIARGALADAMGLPAEAGFEVTDELPSALPLELVSGEVEKYIADAQAARPDLAAARAAALQARAAVASARSAGLPTISAGGGYDRIYFRGTPTPSNNYSLSLSLNIPISVGVANRFRVLLAEAQAEAAKAQMEQTAQSVIVQVWTSYFDLRTSAQRITTARDLVESAEESYRVAAESYRKGVESILDLLTAESALDGARVQLLQARTDWLLALVQFTHDTGILGRPETTPSGVFPVPVNGKGDDRR